jgi:MATE family multidrug resistance protein
MTRAQHYKINLKLALPVMLGQLGHIMASVADSVMVGQLGTVPLAAVALANSIVVIFMLFGIGLAMGITPLVANAAGKRRAHLQGTLFYHGIYTHLAVGVALFLLSAAMIPALNFLGQDPAVISLTGPYMFLIALSVVPFMLFLSFKQFAEGLEHTRIAMAVSIVCNLINVLLNYILIFGKLGFEPLGILGAGYATLIARTLMALAMGTYVLLHKRFRPYKLRVFGGTFRNKVSRRILQVGVPTGLQFIFEVSAFSLAAVFAGMLGAKALAAHQIAINIASVSYMAVTGLGAAAAVRVGNQVGRGDVRNLRMASTTIFRMATIWMGFAGLVIFLFRGELAGFYSSDPDVLALAGSMLLIAVVFQLSDGLQAVALGALRGFTDVRVPTFITFVAYWLITLPAAYLVSQHSSLGALGIWVALAGGLTISAALLMLRFFSLMKRFNFKPAALEEGRIGDH